ncbi:benzoate 1,2-dioxygenase large subunit [Corynebacterium hindlerae]|uniref:benzoate 1,2-dioxygenase large subunit n=1 Tax=Corynebacterium hindlerae TaxID=699041 RepID=UPI001AD60CA0|nr:benzoate 1,2-dioxygenase large subunit [Corynebacterium hindlerae]QTH59724.1 benzoate 1,2-dioxygenase large subunit [Corynebacterium hindlerae]
MTTNTNNARHLVETALENEPDKGIIRVNRAIFTDPELFELEMKYLFEGNWIYLAHESQIPNPGDYFTTYMGRQPIVITRSKDGELNALINACSHRGAMLCRRKTDNRTTLTCPFHGWTFSNDGSLIKVKDEKDGAYPENFRTDGSHDLRRVPRFESYRGFLFGSLNPDVPPLEEHLGDTRTIIDMLVNQSPEGLEVLRGSSTYTYDGNWKLQTENGADGYHVSSTHWNYAATTSRRSTGESTNTTKAMDAGTWGKQGGGYYSYPNGHLLLWMWWGNPTDRPLYERKEELKAEFGENIGEFMVGASRNLCLYPNVYIMDQFSSQIRHIRPISVDKTEVTIYCIAPKGESATARAARIRQYEDFFNATGMATPDDLEEFRSCQKTYQAAAFPWNDMTRGVGHQLTGPDEVAKGLGMNEVLSSGARTEDEGLYPIQHAHWENLMRAALDQDETTNKAERDCDAAFTATQAFAAQKADKAKSTAAPAPRRRRRR